MEPFFFDTEMRDNAIRQETISVDSEKKCAFSMQKIKNGRWKCCFCCKIWRHKHMTTERFPFQFSQIHNKTHWNNEEKL